jgi:hypothetical protein
MKQLDITYQTLYSELAQRSLDAAFTSDFSLDGRFVAVEVKGRKFWYYDAAKQPGDEAPKRRTYVGPADDPEITGRVERFKDLKADYKARRKIVSTLVREAYLPRPQGLSGDIVEALADAGFFRLRGVLVGTVAFQCYSAILGLRMSDTNLQTADADFAQFHSIAVAVEDSLPAVLDVLKRVDPTFRELPDQNDGRFTSCYASRSGYRVEFLTPNTGSDAYAAHPAKMPALGATAAQPLRFLDFLIYQPVRAVLLHNAGIPVLVPAPERYAVHKLIVAGRRQGKNDGLAKGRKDLRQAAELIEALKEARRTRDLAEAFAEASGRGPHWREAIRSGIDGLTEADRQRVDMVLSEALRRIGEDYAELLSRPKPAAPAPRPGGASA